MFIDDETPAEGASDATSTTDGNGNGDTDKVEGTASDEAEKVNEDTENAAPEA